MIDIIYFPNLEQALEELEKRNSVVDRKGLVARVDRSPYGGFRVYSVPADQLVEQLADGTLPPSTWANFPLRRVAG